MSIFCIEIYFSLLFYRLQIILRTKGHSFQNYRWSSFAPSCALCFLHFLYQGAYHIVLHFLNEHLWFLYKNKNSKDSIRGRTGSCGREKKGGSCGWHLPVVKIIFCNLNINFVSIRKQQNYEEKQFLKEDFLQEVEYFLTGRHLFSLVACFFYLFQAVFIEANSFFSHL